MRRRTRGFTLLEVLVATTIMAIAVVTLLSALTTSLRNASKVLASDQAWTQAKNTLDALLVDTTLSPGQQLQGQWPNGGAWRARIEPFESAPGVRARIDRVALEVSWPRGSGRRTLHLEGFRRSPTPGWQ